MIHIDEAVEDEHAPEKISSTLMPMLQNVGAFGVIVTSPGDGSSTDFVAQLQKVRDERTNKPVCTTITHSEVCDACMLLPEMKDRLECEHLRYRTPPWQNESSKATMKRVVSFMANSAAALRELAGVNASDNLSVFKPATLDKLFEVGRRHCFSDEDNIEVVHIGVDPSGKVSHLAFCACVYVSDVGWVVRHLKRAVCMCRWSIAYSLREHA